MNSISEFFNSRDPDSQFLLISLEGLISNLIAILAWMYINSDSINMIFVSSAAMATVGAYKLPTWNEKFKVMLFICLCVAAFQFGLSIFIFNKILILIFMFMFLIIIFSIRNYQVYAAMSLFPAVTIIGSNTFSFQDAVNRCLYQLIAFLIAFFLATVFSLLFSKYMIKKSIISYLYFLFKQFKHLKKDNHVLLGFSKESFNLQKMGSLCLFNCLKKQYLLKSQTDYAEHVLRIIPSIFAISRALLMLKNLDRKNLEINKTFDDIELNFESIIKAFKKGQEVKINGLNLIELGNGSSRYSISRKNIFALNNIIIEMKKLNGTVL